MRLVFPVLLALAAAGSAPADLSWTDHPDQGTVTIREDGREVLAFRYGDQSRDGVDPQYTRSGYIHPLYGLDGTVLTDDFPSDHYHHRGVFWPWPNVNVRGQSVQTWHPSPLRQYFGRWLLREAPPGQPARLDVENTWKLNGQETVARERVQLTVFPTSGKTQAIDVALTFEAVGGPLQVAGESQKGYGGLCVRGAPLFKGAALATNQGPLPADSTNVPFEWASMASADQGLTIFVHPDHPDFPPSWLIRNSYAGILNVSWPGLEPATLAPGQSVTLRYRLLIHPAGLARDALEKAYRDYRSSAP